MSINPRRQLTTQQNGGDFGAIPVQEGRNE